MELDALYKGWTLSVCVCCVFDEHNEKINPSGVVIRYGNCVLKKTKYKDGVTAKSHWYLWTLGIRSNFEEEDI